MRPYLHLLCFLLCLSSALARADFALQWQPPQDGSEELFAGALRDSGIIQDAAKLQKQNVAWPPELSIVMGGAGLPRYLPDTQSIHMPYSYLADAVRGQSNFEESRAAALQKGLDVVEYSLYHLLGHALIGDHSVDHDERAESLATWLMVSSFVSGGEQWLEDIQAFGRASQKLDGPLQDYWHSHGLSKRAEQRLNCLVIGSAPADYLQRFPGLLESPGQTAACKTQWAELESLVISNYQSKP